MRDASRPAATFALTLALLVAGWEALSRSGLYSPHLFPPPTRVAAALREMSASGELWSDLRASGWRWAWGVLIGNAAGVVLGLATGRLAWARHSVGGTMNMLRTLPFMVLIPFSILWFG